jgi:hypothetical protein
MMFQELLLVIDVPHITGVFVLQQVDDVCDIISSLQPKLLWKVLSLIITVFDFPCDE